jgi:uroporphyrinogen decarboxylase
MRQAGRSLPEYRELRDRFGFGTLLRTPELATRVTLQPVERLGVDAAILFSDILVPAEALGLKVQFQPGPVLDRKLSTFEDVSSLHPAPAEEAVPYAFETIRLLRRELAVPLIGFAASPFTLAAYLVEGRGAKGFEAWRALCHAEPQTAHRLLEAITAVTLDYLGAQVRAGAQAIQLFDSWAGLVDPAGYREFNLRYVQAIFEQLAATGVPRIYFALGAAHLLGEVAATGADVIGVDWRIGLAEAARRLGGNRVLQGNLDPAVLLASPAVIERRAAEVLREAEELPGHIFNLGHGVLPETPVAHLAVLVETVRRLSERDLS